MFTEKANATFNNVAFTSPMIRAMQNHEQQPIHAQVQRLYLAAKSLRNAEKKAAVAKLLNISPQNLNGWEERGISEGGLLKAQEVIGCNAIWLRDGTGDMVTGAAALPSLSAAELAELITLYEQADPEGRKSIFDMARAMARMNASARSAAVGD